MPNQKKFEQLVKDFVKIVEDDGAAQELYEDEDPFVIFQDDENVQRLLGDLYLEACEALGKEPKILDADEDSESEEEEPSDDWAREE